jgi:hypothetical protein
MTDMVVEAVEVAVEATMATIVVKEAMIDIKKWYQLLLLEIVPKQ